MGLFLCVGSKLENPEEAQKDFGRTHTEAHRNLFSALNQQPRSRDSSVYVLVVNTGNEQYGFMYLQSVEVGSLFFFSALTQGQDTSLSSRLVVLVHVVMQAEISQIKLQVNQYAMKFLSGFVNEV